MKRESLSHTPWCAAARRRAVGRTVWETTRSEDHDRSRR